MALVHRETGTSWHWYTGRLGRHGTGTQGDWDVTDSTGTQGDWDVTGTQGHWDLMALVHRETGTSLMALVHRETGTSWHWYTGRLQNYRTCIQMAVIDSESEIVYTEIRRTGAAIAAYVFIPTQHFFLPNSYCLQWNRDSLVSFQYSQPYKY